MLTATTFLNDDRYASFSDDFSDETIAAVISEVIDDLPVDIWGTLQDRAAKLLTCHRLTCQRNAQAGIALSGNITSLSVSQGSESLSLSGGTGDRTSDPEGLMDTQCGREFLSLRRRVMGNFTGFVA